MSVEEVEGRTSTLRADARRNRDRIMVHALRQFSTEGIGTSLEEIAREAGVGIGTLYRHFPSREDLLSAVLRERQAALSLRAQQAREKTDPDAALSDWLEALQDYLRSFNGLPEPVLSAMKEQASPLALSCEAIKSITREFLERAQRDGSARRSVTPDELLLTAIGLAWVLDRAESYGTNVGALNAIFERGYFYSRS